MITARREQNRAREHSAEGHQLTEGIKNQRHIPGTTYATGAARLYSCVCGWKGWMRPGITEDLKLAKMYGK